jgi:hypothetical protein
VPLTHTNQLLRAPTWTLASMGSLAVLMGFSAVCLALVTARVRRYSE